MTLSDEEQMASSSETDSPSESDDSASGNEDTSGVDDDSEGVSESTDKEEDDNVNDATGSGSVENQIEGDFDRLIGSIRASDDVASTNMLSKLWDAQFPEDADTFHDDLRGASGIGRRKKKKGAHRRGPPLSHEVRHLIGKGNHAYMEGNAHEAIRIMTEVIRIEPRAMTAWSVLATCHKDINEPLKALQLSIIGAHLKHDADEWCNLAVSSRELGYNQQALYCYGKAVSLDPSNVNAYWDRASLAKSVGELRTARRAYLAILKHIPHSVDVLTELRQILVEFGELKLCATLFQDAFDYYTKAYPLGQSQTSTESANIDPELLGRKEGASSSTQSPVASASPFGLIEVLVLADLYNTLSQHHRAVNVIRTGVRWLQGRAKQHLWDKCADDREYDPEGLVREGDSGGHSLGDLEGENLKQGFYPLDINARHRLAVARLKLGHLNEGKIHVDIILSQSVAEFAPLFAELADAYFEREQYDQARRIYEMLGADAGTSSMYILEQVAACRRNLGDLKEAAEVYEHIISSDPSNNDAKMKLAEIYEITNQPRKALSLVYQVIDSRRRRRGAGDEESESEASSPTDTRTKASLFAEKKSKGKRSTAKVSQTNRQRLSKEELVQLEQKKESEASRAYARVKQLWDSMLQEDEAAEKEWLIEAEKLVEMFRETRALFSVLNSVKVSSLYRLRRLRQDHEAEEDSMASRLQLELGQETLSQKSVDKRANSFRGIHFDEWIALVMQYTFLLTRKDQFALAEEVLRHFLVSSAYQSRIAQDKIRIALITCALHARKHTIVLEQCRKLMFAHQFNNEPLRILVASLASGLNQTDQFLSSTLQKYLLRELRMMLAATKGKQLMWNSASRRYAPAQSDKSMDADAEGDDGDRDPDEEEKGTAESSQKGSATVNGRFAEINKPTKENPVIVTIYGQACTVVRSYQSALFYLLAAYDYCPSDPMICLNLCIASIGRAMQRQADNRHYLVAQGIGFLTKYRDLRLEQSPEYEDEVEFNYGRAFNQLGLLTHAVKHYERVLQIAEGRTQSTNKKDNNVAKEAAYNLSLIYVQTGAAPLAQELYRKWLAV